jgi:hypothetical protein
MFFSPSLNPGHLFRAGEIGLIRLLLEPAMLSPCLAFSLTLRLGAKPLTISCSGVRVKQLSASQTLTLSNALFNSHKNSPVTGRIEEENPLLRKKKTRPQEKARRRDE